MSREKRLKFLARKWVGCPIKNGWVTVLLSVYVTLLNSNDKYISFCLMLVGVELFFTFTQYLMENIIYSNYETRQLGYE